MCLLVLLLFAQCDVFGEIGEVIVGQKQAFWEKTTVFKSVGKLMHHYNNSRYNCRGLFYEY